MREHAAATLLDGLAFGECPRWHDGRLWVSDMHAGRVFTVDEEGGSEPVFDLPTRPAGLGWLPDGRLLVVSMTDRRVLRLDPEGLALHADLAALATGHCNDMVVDDVGRAYVGNFGFDLDAGESARPADLVAIEPDGTARVAATGLDFPNGAVLTPDGSSLIVGETFAGRLTAFDVAADGSLSNRRVWAQLDGAVPDGICLDAEGAVWVACPMSGRGLRVLEGGEVTDVVSAGSGHNAFACMLGGHDRRTLFVCTAEGFDPDTNAAQRTGRIVTARVEVPGAGRP